MDRQQVREALGRRPVGDHGGLGGGPHDQPQPLLGLAGVDRQVGAAGPQHTQAGGHRLGAAAHRHGHHRPPAQAGRRQAGRHPARPLVQLAVAERPFSVLNGHRFRPGECLTVHQFGHGAVPFARPACLGAARERRQDGVRLAEGGTDRREQSPVQGGGRLGGEQGGVVLQFGEHRLAAPGDVPEQLVLGGAGGEQLALRPGAVRPQARPGLVQVGDRELGERCPGQVAAQPQLLHHGLEGDLLVRQRLGDDPSDQPHQAAGGGPRRDGEAQRQGVDEHADLGALFGSARRDGDGDHQVPVTGHRDQAGEIGRHPGHERAEPLLFGERGDRAQQFGRRLGAVHPAGHPEHPRPRPVVRERGAAGRQAGQRAAPVREGCRAVLQPGRDGLRHRNRGRGRAALVQLLQLGLQQRERQAVADQVVQGEQQQIAVRPAVHQQRPEQGRAAEIEGLPRLLVQQPPQRRVRRPGGVQLTQRNRGPAEREGPARCLEAAPQRLVAGGQGVERLAQPGRPQLAVEPVQGADVVDRGAPVQLLDEPQPLLGGRQFTLRAASGAGQPGLQDRQQGAELRVLVEQIERQLGAGQLPQAHRGLHREDGVAALEEEVVLVVDLGDPQARAPDVGHGLAQRLRHGSHPPRCRSPRCRPSWSCPSRCRSSRCRCGVRCG